MTMHKTGILLAVTLAGLTLGACATEDYVDEHVGAVNTRVDQVSARVDELGGQVAAVNSRIAGAAGAAQTAQSRADAAYTLAQGKFVMTEVGRAQVSFDTNKSALSPEAKTTLVSLAERLKTENKN